MLWSIDTCQNNISTDHIAGSSIELTEVTFFFELLAFQLDRGHKPYQHCIRDGLEADKYYI